MYTPDDMQAVSREIGTLMVNNVLLERRVAMLSEAGAEKDKVVEGLKARLVAYETDIDALRVELGAKRVARRGKT